jgi:hypothetical protein
VVHHLLLAGSDYHEVHGKASDAAGAMRCSGHRFDFDEVSIVHFLPRLRRTASFSFLCVHTPTNGAGSGTQFDY